MSKKKRSNEQLEAENELLRQHGFGNNITKVFLALIKWGAVLGLGYFTKEIFVALAGKDTFADIKVIGWLGWLLGDKEGFAHWPCAILGLSSLVVGGIGIAYGRRQRVLRERAVEHIHPRVKALEGRLDPARTSSGLDVRGNTPKEEG